MCRVGGITCNAEDFAGEMGAVDVLEGGERDTNNLLSCQVAHLAPVVGLISVADETHHNRVIRKFNEEVGLV